MNFNKISVIGLGYIGLPTATAFAVAGKTVVGIDINQSTVDIINQGKIHIVEPELEDAVKSVVASGRLRAATVPESADAFLIAVPTPFKGDHEPDLSYVEAAARSIAPVLEQGNLVILESTSPVGTTEEMAQWLAAIRPDLRFPQQAGESANVNIAYCPERVLPGKIMQELICNDRVIGGMTARCSKRAVALYQTFVKGECITTNTRTAEMCKLTENSFRDVNIAFANELSMICDKLDIDVWELRELANRHPRVNILQPGPGVGGHCIAVDPWFIVNKVPDEAKLIHTARIVNDNKIIWVTCKIQSVIRRYLEDNLNKSVSDIVIGFYGLAFKADVNDLRESPALKIVKNILKIHLGKIMIVEPNIHKLPEELSSAQFVDIEEILKNADVHVMLVDHKEFKEIKEPRQKNRTVDVRGIWFNR